MDEPLSFALRLDRNECLRGESVFFEIILKNTSRAPLARAPTFDPEFPQVRLVLDGPGGTLYADQGSGDERNGFHEHGSDEEPPEPPLGPGQERTLKDDLLVWFGELEPGKYKIRAEHEWELVTATIPFKVAPAVPVFASTPRYASQALTSPLSAAWVHKEDKSFLLFFQQQSSALPRNPVHGLRAVEIESKEPVEVHAAVTPDPRGTEGHLVWMEKGGAVHMATADLRENKLRADVEIEMPFKGTLLASPMTAEDGTMWLAITDSKRKKVSILQAKKDGSFKKHDLDLGKGAPMGPYACFWEDWSRLQFFWAAEKGREVSSARLTLEDPASGFITRSAFVSNDPIVWIDAYFDRDASFREVPYLVENTPPDLQRPPQAPAPKLMLWCVTDEKDSLGCTQVNVTDGRSQPGPRFDKSGIKEARVIASVVNRRYGFSILLADAEGRLFYGSTQRGTMCPLADLAAGKEIGLDQFPGLMAAGQDALGPWVHLRYVKDNSSIDYIRLEPSNDMDPVERRQRKTAKPTRRRGR